MSRPMRRPARARVRRRPLYETLEGRYSAGSLLAGPVIGGIALPSVRPVEPVGGDDAAGLARAKDRVPAVPAPRRPAAGVSSLPRSIVPARVDSTRMPALLRSPLAAAARPEDQGPLMARDAALASQVITTASPRSPAIPLLNGAAQPSGHRATSIGNRPASAGSSPAGSLVGFLGASTGQIASAG